jgi:hypothetical protein
MTISNFLAVFSFLVWATAWAATASVAPSANESPLQEIHLSPAANKLESQSSAPLDSKNNCRILKQCIANLLP